MVAPIDLVNRALVLLGEQPIMALDQPCKPARVASIMYEGALESELSGHPWHFAKKRQILAEVDDPDAPDGEASYRLPSDWLQSLAVCTVSGEEDLQAVHEGAYIRSPNPSGVMLSYLAKIDDPSAWPALFREVLVLRLAVDMAQSLTQSGGSRASLNQAYELALRKARHANAWMASPASLPVSHWITHRR